MKRNSGERTLLASVLLSSPGPLVLGIALVYGRSSTQIADFIRRTVELGAIIISWIVFRMLPTSSEPDPSRKARLEALANTCVGAAMLLSGLAMLFIAVFSTSRDKGNVIPGLAIAFLGVIVNFWFWLRYRRLNHEQPNAVLEVQSRLYGAKFAVDTCVVVALLFVAVLPHAPITTYLDAGGSIAVALYLAWSGINTIRKRDMATE
ncbi:MAG: cation transporter [Firmicutes bacterium]|nr:cation transporter [Bacillota bacterium]